MLGFYCSTKAKSLVRVGDELLGYLKSGKSTELVRKRWLAVILCIVLVLPGTVALVPRTALADNGSYFPDRVIESPGGSSGWSTSPAVATGNLGDITNKSAIVSGDLADLGAASEVEVSFEWGVTISCDSRTASQAMTATGPFSFELRGLSSNTSYYYRAKAAGSGVSYGEVKGFETSSVPVPPTVRTWEADNMTDTSARLGAGLICLGSAGEVAISLVYGTTKACDEGETGVEVVSSEARWLRFDVGDLLPGVTYYYRAKGVGNGVDYGAVKSFRTSSVPVPPTVRTCEADNRVEDMMDNLASLVAMLDALGSIGEEANCEQSWAIIHNEVR